MAETPKKNWLQKIILDAAMKNSTMRAIDDRADQIVAPVQNTPVAPPPLKQINNDDEMMDYLKKVVFNAAQPEDVRYGQQALTFVPVDASTPTATGYAGDMYNKLLGYNPKHKPVFKK